MNSLYYDPFIFGMLGSTQETFTVLPDDMDNAVVIPVPFSLVAVKHSTTPLKVIRCCPGPIPCCLTSVIMTWIRPDIQETTAFLYTREEHLAVDNNKKELSTLSIFDTFGNLDSFELFGISVKSPNIISRFYEYLFLHFPYPFILVY
jgi:hypothetical protein